MIRKWMAAAAAALLLWSPVNCFAAQADGTAALKIGGSETASGAVVKNGKLYLALDPVCEALGYAASDASSTGPVELLNGADGIRIDPARNQMDDNGHTVDLSALTEPDTLGGGCLLSGGRIYVRSELLSQLLGLDVGTDETTGTVTARRILQNVLTVKTERTDVSEGLLTAHIQYPVLSGSGNDKFYQNINGILKEAADSALAEGRKNAGDLAGYAASAPDYGGPIQCETDFDYRIPYNQNGLVSIVLTEYQYSGGAHGSTVQTAYTFDLKTGKALSLFDLVKSGAESECRGTVDALVRKFIDTKVYSGELMELPDLPFKTVGETPNYYLSDDGVMIYFQQYEHFPYAAGIQEFRVDYLSLAQYLDPAYASLAAKDNRIG